MSKQPEQITQEQEIKIADVSDEVIKEAIALRFSECFVAMMFARAFNGRAKSPQWDILENLDTEVLMNEANRRSIPIEQIPTAVSTIKGELVGNSVRFKTYLNDKRSTTKRIVNC